MTGRSKEDQLIIVGNAYAEARRELQAEVCKAVQDGELPVSFVAQLAGVPVEWAIRASRAEPRPRSTAGSAAS